MNNNLSTDTTVALLKSAQAEQGNVAESLKKAKNLKAIEEAAQEFEAVFLAAMLKPMFAQLKPDETFGGGKGEEVFQGLMVQEYGKMIAQTGQVGIAEHVKQELLRIQEEVNNGNEG